MREKNIDGRKIEMDYEKITVHIENDTRQHK